MQQHSNSSRSDQRNISPTFGKAGVGPMMTNNNNNSSNNYHSSNSSSSLVYGGGGGNNNNSIGSGRAPPRGSNATTVPRTASPPFVTAHHLGQVGLAVERLTVEGEAREVAQQAAQEVMAALSEAEDTIVTLLEENRVLRAYVEGMSSLDPSDITSSTQNSNNNLPLGSNHDMMMMMDPHHLGMDSGRGSGGGRGSGSTGGGGVLHLSATGDPTLISNNNNSNNNTGSPDGIVDSVYRERVRDWSVRQQQYQNQSYQQQQQHHSPPHRQPSPPQQQQQQQQRAGPPVVPKLKLNALGGGGSGSGGGLLAGLGDSGPKGRSPQQQQQQQQQQPQSLSARQGGTGLGPSPRGGGDDNSSNNNNNNTNNNAGSSRARGVVPPLNFGSLASRSGSSPPTATTAAAPVATTAAANNNHHHGGNNHHHQANAATSSPPSVGGTTASPIHPLPLSGGRQHPYNNNNNNDAPASSGYSSHQSHQQQQQQSPPAAASATSSSSVRQPPARPSMVPLLNLARVDPYADHAGSASGVSGGIGGIGNTNNNMSSEFAEPLPAPRGERPTAQVGVYIERAVVVEGPRGRGGGGGGGSGGGGGGLGDSRISPRDESPVRGYTHNFATSGSGMAGAVGLYIEHTIAVFSVVRGGPADKAKVRAGDVVLKVDGRLCGGKQLGDVLPFLAGDAGTVTVLSMLRPATNVEFTVALTRTPAADAPRGGRSPGFIGLQIDRAVLIRSLVEGGAAASSGIIKRGDILEKVDRVDAAPQTLDSLRRQITGASGTRVTLRIWRPPGQLQMDVCLTRTG